ncbi:uncharacterized protein LOC127859985 isoform X2 [Dreissena polymorpha]|uniref:uncharacterized protein LOC127859985 isoform X2 n=1 Tax=Dreissena polymorpha TaxID=45954 RepID=UPI00226531D2|nr:uncharacterized protein LOC127859985 isoform X2 [Dreissena polymorpha]XP_052253623.1 uncharacterized protein LOC127859985 isoform X2 [Dreissena polymorpha]XP_052253624.1 uncharacterized protein LOC127859985 isoform X2 [Dreissena polymorpha]
MVNLWRYGTQSSTPLSADSSSSLHSELPMYIGISLGGGVLLCLIILVTVICYKRRAFTYTGNRRASGRQLFIRGFSFASNRGVIDSTAEFEFDTSRYSPEGSPCVNAQNAADVSKSNRAPKKPNRRKTRTSSSNAKYENVTLDPVTGKMLHKSDTMNSDIPYMDSTMESRLSHDDTLDDVFI